MYRRAALLLVAAGWGANHFSPLLLVYRRELSLSPSALGILFAAYALGLVPGLMVAGRASDSRGRRTMVLMGSYLCILASAVLAFGAAGFGILLGGRLLYGLGMGCVMGPGSVWVQELSPPELGPRRATFALSTGFGLGALVAGLSAELLPLPMILPYLLHISFAIVALVVARPVPETAARGGGAKSAGLGRREIGLLAQLLPAAPWTFGFGAIALVTLPAIFRAQVGRPILYAAVTCVITLAAGVLVQPLTTRIGKHADLVGLALGTVGAFVGAETARHGAPYVATIADMLLGAGYGLVVTTGLREIAEKVGARERGTVVGIFYVQTYIGFSLPFIYAGVAREHGDHGALIRTVILIAACLVARAVIKVLAR